MYKLILLDLDGTLLHSDKTIQGPVQGISGYFEGGIPEL